MSDVTVNKDNLNFLSYMVASSVMQVNDMNELEKLIEQQIEVTLFMQSELDKSKDEILNQAKERILLVKLTETKDTR